MGLLKEIIDKIDLHQDPVYLDCMNLPMKKSYKDKNRQNSIECNVGSDSSTVQININITINDDEG